MKFILLLLTFLLSVISIKAQVNKKDSIQSSSQFLITKHNGAEFTGTIISDDGREILIETKTLGKIYIPKSEVKSIVKIVDQSSIVNGEFQSTGPFTTRYAFTNNALPIVKGENYTMVNLFGPEVHFAVSNNFNIGIMSTWIASPLVLAMKYSIKTNDEEVNFSIGTLLGSTGYLNNFKGYGGLHWLSMTLGSRKNNVTFSAGYAYLQSGRKISNPEVGVYHNEYPPMVNELRPMTRGPILSAAGIFKVGAKVSFIFDSMFGFFKQEQTKSEYEELTPGNYYNGASIAPTFNYVVTKEEYLTTALFVMPGLRFQHSDRKAFQICIAGVSMFGQRNVSFPFPMCSWFTKF